MTSAVSQEVTGYLAQQIGFCYIRDNKERSVNHVRDDEHCHEK